MQQNAIIYGTASRPLLAAHQKPARENLCSGAVSGNPSGNMPCHAREIPGTLPTAVDLINDMSFTFYTVVDLINDMSFTFYTAVDLINDMSFTFYTVVDFINDMSFTLYTVVDLINDMSFTFSTTVDSQFIIYNS